MARTEVPWVCGVCLYWYKSVSEVQKHYSDVHYAGEDEDATQTRNERKESTDSIVSQCNAQPQSLQEPTEALQQLDPSGSSTEQLQNSNASATPLERTGVCLVCDKKLSYKGLIKHIRNMHNTPEHQWVRNKICCPICGLSLCVASLQGHIEIQHSEVSLDGEDVSFRCKGPTCFSNFTHITQYIQHLRTDHP